MDFGINHSGLMSFEELQGAIPMSNSFSFPVREMNPIEYPLSEQFPNSETWFEWLQCNTDKSDDTWTHFLCNEEEHQENCHAEPKASMNFKDEASYASYAVTETTSTSNFSTPEISSISSCVSISSVAPVQGNVLRQPSSSYCESAMPAWTQQCNSSAGTTTDNCHCSEEVSSSQDLPHVMSGNTRMEESCIEPQVCIFRVTCDDPSLGDGFIWRKYGQKNIKGRKFPRSYFRCANSGCPVRKQTESCSEKEGVVLIKYIGKHNHAI